MALALALALAIPLGAVAAVTSQGYQTKEKLPPGTLVSLDGPNAQAVIPATTEKLENLLGVVVAPEGALLNVEPNANGVQVATSGVTPVFVTLTEGEIKVGDKLTASNISGVGVRAKQSGKILGVAQGEFTESSQSVKRQITAPDGSTTEVKIGQVPVLVDVAYFVAGGDRTEQAVPKFIQDLANAIGGKDVPAIRVIISMLIFFISLLAISVLMYGAVRNSIISIGRNPLSQHAVRQSLLQVVFVSTAIMMVAMGVIYFLLAR